MKKKKIQKKIKIKSQLIKNNFQESYKDISDEKLNKLVSFIKNIKN